MNDWLHCNKCFVRFQPDKPDIKFYLVECAHVFCENCVKQVHTTKCLICGKSDMFIPINKDMNTSAQPFFLPIETHLKKVIEVYNFQTMHRQRLCHSQTQKYQYLKRAAFNYEQKMKALISDNKMMRSILLNNTRQNYPTPGGPNDDNMSVVSSIQSFTPNIKSTPIIPGYAHRIPQHDGNIRGVPIPYNQPHLHGATGYYRPSPNVMGHQNRKLNMPSVHKPPSTASSMSQLHGKRT
ncbi:unnamed protein product [Psylliodes chrysocephalus]|uniref:RING-type domain-containing protein n=1 Tax=Psylliodes chrysocephalus TaxID=3402493 RepID=A0A9P0GN91_9CUCU|nr:unnamed protein product [Psylliodes chrysocephala]